MADNPLREPVQIVEVLQPFCSRTFGSAPCTATGTADTKCYNTRSTCQDVTNFALGDPLTLRFKKGNPAEEDISDLGYAIPSLVEVSTAPTRINLAGANPDAAGLGNRALCTINFKDHQHTDRFVDPYVTGRSWDPLDKARGSFWTRWLVRNKYRQNVIIKVYEGYSDQALSEMNIRQYFLQSVQGPRADGSITIQGKDVLARIEERKAQAPLASPGVLFSAMDASQTTLTASGADTGDYAATGTLRIGDEIMTYSSRSAGSDGVDFSGVTRGTDGTTADTHDANEAVQQCLRYTAERADDILEDLLTTYGGVPSSYLNTAEWATEFDDYMAFYNLTALITEPTPVDQLVSEIQEQAMCYLWWDERTALVEMKAIRGIDSEPDTLTDSANIVAGSVGFKEKPRERVSQVWVYYDQQDYVNGLDRPLSFKSLFVNADLDAETEELYGEPSIRKIYARWLPSGALAENTASKILTRYVDVPHEVRFQMDAKDRGYWVGDTVKLSHYQDVDQYGEVQERQWTIVSAEEVVPGEVVEYVAEDTTLYGRIHYVMAAGAADYPGAASAPFKNCYIGDANGLLSDGTSAGKIS